MSRGISQLDKPRKPDSEFPMLMTKETLGGYLGRDASMVDWLILNTELGRSAMEYPRKQTVYSKLVVNKWLKKEGW